jgi:hypothetical protein
VASYRIQSHVLNETRQVLVATPASFAKTTRPFPVILAFDGEYLFPDVLASAAYLADAGQIPEAIVVGIENTNRPEDRIRDLTPPGLSVSGSGLKEGGDRFLDFIERELLPALATQFRAAKPCILVGHSSGAILATYAGATRGGAFPFIVALDAPAHLDGNWLPARLMERAARDTPPPLRYVTLESRYGWTDKAWQALQGAAPKAWRLHREKLTRESHNSMKLLGTYLGLRRVFDDYSMLELPDLPAARALAYYQALDREYGAAQAPPRRLLLRLLEEQTWASRAAEAKSILGSLNESYGRQADAASWEAKIKEIASRPPPKETVEGLLKTPRPTPEEAKQYLGEWHGQGWVNDSPKRPLQLRVFVKDGKVECEVTYFPDATTTLRMPGEYLKVMSDGLHFGHMNGVNPRGVLIFEGRLRGDVLEGTIKNRGVQFSYPAGMKPPVHGFSLERKH